MGMLTRGVSLAFFGCQNDGSVSIYDRSVDTEALKKKTVRERSGCRCLEAEGDEVKEVRTLARMRSVDMAVGSCRPPRSDG
jgi:hypothetical protein